jgi:hypothetical protein
LIVAGDGNTSLGGNNSGGIIQHITGHGISLAGTQSPSFTNMNIQDTGGSGINGAGVTNFTFTNGTILNAGDASVGAGQSAHDSAIAFNGTNTGVGNNIAGTLTVTGNIITNAFYAGLDVESDAGTVTSANVSNNTITNPGFSGVTFSTTGTPTTAFSLNDADINNNNISSSGGNGIQISMGNGNVAASGAAAVAHAGFVTIDGAGRPVSDASHIISITGNLITLDNGVGSNATQAITVASTSASAGARTQINFEILNNGTVANPLGSSAIGTVILIGNNGYSDMAGVVNNSQIDASHTVDFGGGNGIAGGNGVGGAGTAWTPRLNLTVSNNVIKDTDGSGILLVNRATNGEAYFKINNNNVAVPLFLPGGFAEYGIRVDAGNNTAGEDSEVYLNIFGNVCAGGHDGGTGIGIRKQGTVATTNDFGIFDAAGGPSLAASPTNTDVVNFINALNPSAVGGTLIISGSNYLRDTTLAPALLFAPTAPVDVAPITPNHPTIPSNPPVIVIAPDVPPAVMPRPTAPLLPVIVDDGILSQADLDLLVSAATARWAATGVSAEQLDALLGTSFTIEDLPGWYLGEASPGHATLDVNAAGNGWFIDPTPMTDGDVAAGHIDLLTTIMHEMGHQLGLGDSYLPADRDRLMYGYLTLGERRLPATGQAIGADPHAHDGEIGPDFLFTPINVGTLTFGTTIRIRFTAQIANPLVGVGSVSNQGTVSGGNFASVPTDDPDAGLPGAQPTVTPVQPATPNAPDLQSASDSGASNADNITNVANPVFDVTGADAAATVELLREGVVVASRTGPGTITDTGAPAGNRTYTVRQRFGVNGINSDSPAGLGVTIDRTAPAAPGAPDLQTASDTGVLTTDNVTKVNNATFDTTTGIETAAAVELLRGGVNVVGSRTGAGAISSSAAADGDWSYTLRQTDVAGNVGAQSAALNVRIDTVAPTLTTTPVFNYQTGHSILYSFNELLTNTFSPPTVALQHLGTLAFVPDGNKNVTFLNIDISLGFNPILADGNYRATITGSLTDTAGNAFAGSTLDFFVLAGDANRDRSVDFNDLVALAQNYNTTGKTFSTGDFNYDAKVDFEDLVLLAQRYNTTLSPPAVAAAGVADAELLAVRPGANRRVFNAVVPVRKPAPPPEMRRAANASR